MMEVFKHPRLAPLWERAFDGTLGDWEEIFHDYRATTDAPAVYFFRELADRFPQAKIVLTERDPEKWHSSFAATIGTPAHRDLIANSPLLPMMLKMVQYNARRAGLPPPNPDSPFPPREAMIASFLRHNDGVKRAIPPERLLVFRVAEGWPPLCRFLGVPVPDVPFPRVNDAASFQTIRIDAEPDDAHSRR
jgi:hypothetical protein